MNITERLFSLRDEEYAAFQAKLTPGISLDTFIGVRVPILRKFAKECIKEGDYESFLDSLPHKYYDENMLHGLIISELKDYEICISRLEAFLPYVDNWAVCDIMSPKVFKKNKGKLIEKIKEWSASEETYTCRFGLEMLMSHFLDEDFEKDYLEMPANATSDEYYVKMMVAWFFATALAKQWDDSIIYLTSNRLAVWTHNKTIQKCRERYRITDEQKEYLKTLKRK